MFLFLFFCKQFSLPYKDIYRCNVNYMKIFRRVNSDDNALEIIILRTRSVYLRRPATVVRAGGKKSYKFEWYSSGGNTIETDFRFLDSSSDAIEWVLIQGDLSAGVAGWTTFNSALADDKMEFGLSNFPICEGEIIPISGRIGQLNLQAYETSSSP